MSLIPYILLASFLALYLNMWYLVMTLKNEDNFLISKKPSFFPSISILIPAHNEENTIKNTLDSVLSLDYPKSKLEVIVIDNGSKDKTSEVVKKYKKVKLIKTPKPSKAHALNLGLKKVKNKFVGILDADTTVSKDCLKQIVGFFDDKKVAAVATFVKVKNSKSFLGKIQEVEYLFSAASKKIVSFVNSLYITPGTLSVLRIDAIKDVGGFSDDTVTEDVDLAIAMRKKGYKIEVAMNAITYTNVPLSLRKLSKQRIRWYRGFIENSVKHFDIFFKVPHLGSFVIPSAYIGIFIGMILMSSVIFSNLKLFIVELKSLYYISFIDKLILFVTNFTLNLKSFLLMPYALTMFLFVFVSSYIVITICLKTIKVKEKKYYVLLPIYILLYYFFIMFVWIAAFFMEITGRKRKW